MEIFTICRAIHKASTAFIMHGIISYWEMFLTLGSDLHGLQQMAAQQSQLNLSNEIS